MYQRKYLKKLFSSNKGIEFTSSIPDFEDIGGSIAIEV